LDVPAPHPHAVRHAERGSFQAAIQKILVVIDPTASEQPALEKAARIAASCRGSLELYVCDVEQDIPESWVGGSRSAEYREILRQRLLQDLGRLAGPLRARGLDVTTVCEWHAPVEEGIGHHVIRTQPGLVVKETHWHASMPRVTSTRTDWNLIRHLPVPLLLVRRTMWPSRPRVAVSVDPSHPADRPTTLDDVMLDEGRSIADALAGDLDVFHALQTPPHLPGEVVPSELKADIHVVGAVALPRWVHSAANGTASQMLERIGCDLLILKPPGFVSPLLVTDE
jgi:universal stress protein E